MTVACYRAISQEPENDGQAFVEAWLAARGRAHITNNYEKRERR
jgi:hypothetical protein